MMDTNFDDMISRKTGSTVKSITVQDQERTKVDDWREGV